MEEVKTIEPHSRKFAGNQRQNFVGHRYNIILSIIIIVLVFIFLCKHFFWLLLNSLEFVVVRSLRLDIANIVYYYVPQA